jgi:hypothetical protein
MVQTRMVQTRMVQIRHMIKMMHDILLWSRLPWANFLVDTLVQSPLQRRCSSNPDNPLFLRKSEVRVRVCDRQKYAS